MHIHAHELCTELALCVGHLLEKLLADGVALPRSLEHVVDIIFHRRRWQRALKWFSPSRQGARAPTITGRDPQGTLAGADPSPEEEPKIDFNHSPFTIREGARGKLIMSQARSRRKGDKDAGSRRTAGRPTSLAKLVPRVAHRLGAIKVGGGGEA